MIGESEKEVKYYCQYYFYVSKELLGYLRQKGLFSDTAVRHPGREDLKAAVNAAFEFHVTLL